jgi:hypothetical protein
MKRVGELFISLSLCVILVSAGCITKQAVDTDHDGYNDNVDAFPTDPNFHEKVLIWSPYTLNLQKGQGADKNFNVESGVKVIVANWSVIYPSNLSMMDQHNITLEITMPPEGNTTQYYYDEVQDRNLRFPVNDSMLGNWDFSFYYSLDSTAENATVYEEIYGMK